jgi:hypothetical protein
MVAPRTEPRPDESESSESKPAAPGGPPPPTRRGDTQVAIAITGIVTGIFIWWALQQGGYFGSVFLPGAMILYGLMILLLIGAPFRGRLGGPVLVALAAITALAAWTLLSLAWTDSHDSAVQYAQRTMLYAVIFALGLWTCNLAGRRMLVPLAASAATGVVVGIVITVTLAGGTDIPSLLQNETLRFPIGYRNAEAAFLLICLWPLLALAAEGDLPWQLRSLMIGGATMLLELAVLSESRGSLPAAAVAFAAFLALSPRRLRAATYLGLAAVPVLPALPTLLDVYQYGSIDAGVTPLLRDSARAIALTSVGSVVLAAVCIRGVEFRLRLGQRRVQLLSRIAAVAAIVVVGVGGTVFVVHRGGPVKFIDQRVSEFKRGGNPNLQPEGTRFGVNAGTNRGDFWRVALDQGGDNPIAGAGAGSFSAAYLRHRDTFESPTDPHSVEALMLSELGGVGLLLFGAFAVAAAASGLRSRRAGPSAAALATGSLAAGAYWLVHASYDWFWNYPALTAPVMFMLGAVAAPHLLNPASGVGKRARYAAAGVLAVALIAALPLFLSQRYADRGYDEFPQDPAAALRDIDRAASLNPYDPQPLLTKGVIEQRLGRDADAISTFRDGLNREPDNYAAHFFLARALAPTDIAAARAEAAEAQRLNPLDRQTRRLNRRLQRRLVP